MTQIKNEVEAITDLVGIIVISQPYKTILTLRYLQEIIDHVSIINKLADGNIQMQQPYRAKEDL